MSEVERSGRSLLLRLIFVTILISATVIGIYLISNGTDRLPQQIVRLLLTVALCSWLYRGSDAARWIMVGLYLLAGIGWFLIPVKGDWFWDLYMSGVAGLYWAMAVILVRSKRVAAFLAYQRSTRRSQVGN